MPTIARAPVAILPSIGMSQSSLMLAALAAGFVVYLAVKQRLGTYWSILLGGGASATATTATSPTTSSTVTTPSNAVAPTASPGTSTIPQSYGSFLGLGGTGASSTATGGTGTPVGTGIIGLPNTSQSTFFGLGS